MITVQMFDIRNTVSHVIEVSNLIAKTAQQSNRIVEFEAVGLSLSIAEALVFPTNNLTRLTISGHGAEELPLIFGDQMPCLKRLTMSNPSGWCLRMFQDVTRVELFGSGSHIHLSSLTDFLDGATSLGELSLSRFWEFRPERQKAPRVIALPSLHDLKFSFCNAPRILDHLNLLPSKRVSILASYDPNNRHTIHYLPTTGSFHSLLYNTESLTVTLHATSDEFYLVTCLRNGEPTCFLQIYDNRKRLDEGWFLRSADAIAEFRPFFHVNALNVSVERCAVPWEQWLRQLDRLVSMDVSSVDVGELVLTLSGTHPRHGGPVCPPNLHRLHDYPPFAP